MKTVWIISASTLKDGSALYLKDNTWIAYQHEVADQFMTKEDAQAALVRPHEEASHICDPYLIKAQVDESGTLILPSARERIRAAGYKHIQARFGY